MARFLHEQSLRVSLNLFYVQFHIHKYCTWMVWYLHEQILYVTNVGSKSNFDHDHHGGSSRAFHFIPAQNVTKHFHGFYSNKTCFVGAYLAWRSIHKLHTWRDSFLHELMKHVYSYLEFPIPHDIFFLEEWGKWGIITKTLNYCFFKLFVHVRHLSSKSDFY